MAAAQQAPVPPGQWPPSSNRAQAQLPLAQQGANPFGLQAAEPARARALSTAAGSTGTWQPFGPAAVNTANYGLVTGRVTSIAFDPADVTGNRVYVGTTGGGVWLSQNAATENTADVQFVPLTDAVGALTTALEGSITVGALTVQPGGTGVVLAGTGDPNNSLDSYYGAGILRSTDGGATWSLISRTTGSGPWAFLGEAFAGFAWSTVNPQLVVAAVSQSFDGTRANGVYPNASYEGLYYSADSGATWSLAGITDGGGSDVEGPQFMFVQPDGNAATSVVWNPIRKLFIAAVRAHGYYQSSDGMTWTRLTAQPGAGLTSANCPASGQITLWLHCPIFRGALAVNPVTGDTFAWTVDAFNQDLGLWQDQCGLAAGVCSNSNLSFGKRVNTAALEVNDAERGPATIERGDYTMPLAAVPSGSDTLLLAGTDDLWRCSLAAGCVWRNVTNAGTCMSAKVAPYQHVLAWSPTNPLEVLIGNDSGLWRSLDAIGETGAACDPGDATHFQNLNSGLGSIAEVGGLSVSGDSTPMVMASLGVNGTVGGKTGSDASADWPQILGGYGGPIAIDPTNSSNWYVNNQAGVSIHLCTRGGDCNPGDFGPAVITSQNVAGDGDTMPAPAPFVVDPLDPSQLLIGTCRVWRGSANGSGWTSANAVSPILGGEQGQKACPDGPWIRSMAARALPDGSEIVYVGMYGAIDGGGVFGGHVFSARIKPNSGTAPVWNDLTSHPVTNNSDGMNGFRIDISSIAVDPHDTTGNTVYVVVEGMPEAPSPVRSIYRSTDGGATWVSMISNLPPSPGNAIVVDPRDANTVYIALDAGVFSTRRIATCDSGPNLCWSAYGSGLPHSPVKQLAAAGGVLVAGTYGRGLWQIPLWTVDTQSTTAEARPSVLTFPTQAYDTSSSAKTVTLTNTGSAALTISSITTSDEFAESDACQSAAIGVGESCSIQVTFSPAHSGTRTGQLTISGNIAGGDITVDLNGVGGSPTGVSLSPSTLSFGSVAVGATSAWLPVTAENPTSAAVSMTSLTVTPPFVLAANACGTSLRANSDCQIQVGFAPSQAGPATGTLTMVDDAGVQTVSLSGTGSALPTDTLSAGSLTFPGTVVGQISQAQTVSMTNSGGLPLTSIVASASGPFQVSSNCGGQLAPNASCAIAVVYQPTAVGGQIGVLTISDALRTQTVALAGTGLPPAQIGVSAPMLDFPSQSIGTSSSPMVLTLTNTGGSPMANIGFQISGFSAASFSIGTSSCGSILNSGRSCTFEVIFTPTVAGGASAQLTLSSSTINVQPVQVELSGIGQAPAGVNVSPPRLTLTAPTLGQPSAAETVTISNAGTGPADDLKLSVDAPFSLTQNTCDSSLAGGGSCTVGVSFTPSGDGAVSGVMKVTSTLNAADVILSGIGGAAGTVQMRPSLLTFATTGVGAKSASQTITVSNTGPIDLPGLALRVSSGFQLTSTSCAPVLQVGATCTASIAFAPVASGQNTGNLTVTSNAIGSPAQAVLSGMGFDFAVSVLGSSSQTVSSGQIARFTLALAPANGSSGTFTFQCRSLPANAVCSFNPTSEPVGAGSTGNVTVQVATGATSTSRQPPARATLAVRIALCGLLLVPCILRARRRAWLAIVLLALVCGVVSCTGAGGGTGGTATSESGGAGASAGTYSIPVDVAANGVSHSVVLTLTVD